MNESTEISSAAAHPSSDKGLLKLLKSKFVKDTVFLQAGTFITVGTYVLTSMLLARSLGPTELGRYDLANRFYDFCFFIANLGLINVTVVRYSQAMGLKSREDQILALAAFLKISLIMAVAVLALGYLLCPFVGETLYGDRRVGFYSWILCTMGLIEIMRVMAKATLLGARRMKEMACLESAIALTRLLVLVLAVVGGFELLGVILGTVLHAGLSSLMGLRYYILLRREPGPEHPPAIREVIRALPRATMKQYFAQGFFIALNKNLMQIVLMFATFFMATISFRDTGLLRIATILLWGLQLLLSGVTQNLLPTLGFKMGHAGHRDITRMGGTLLKVSLVSGLLFLTLTGLFLICIPWVIDWMYGPQYRECIRIVLILASAHLIMGFGVISEPFYIYADRLKTAVKINVVIFALLIPAGYLGTKQFGVIGVAWYLATARFLVIV
ncbi:MAG: oligosaccharide flippase family protein, partial [Planctomycetes bacterium]|nr:oligosaccharide flippase family protein [Planctomycetota bacterium]